MTNEEIITQLQDIKCHCQEMYEAEIKNGDTSSSIWGKDVEALDMAIKALEQQSCDDCVSREDAINVAIDAVDDWDGGCNTNRATMIRNAIKMLPSVTPSIPDVENDFNLGYNCGYADAMCDIGGES